MQQFRNVKYTEQQCNDQTFCFVFFLLMFVHFWMWFEQKQAFSSILKKETKIFEHGIAKEFMKKVENFSAGLNRSKKNGKCLSMVSTFDMAIYFRCVSHKKIHNSKLLLISPENYFESFQIMFWGQKRKEKEINK